MTQYTDSSGSPGLLIKGDALRQNIFIADSQTCVVVQADCNNNNVLTDPGDVDLNLAQDMD